MPGWRKPTSPRPSSDCTRPIEPQLHFGGGGGVGFSYPFGPGARAVFFSTKAEQVFFEHRFEKGDYLIFGSETEGLDEDLRTSRAAEFYRIPQYDERVRSINLACAVSVVVYEAIRQLGP